MKPLAWLFLYVILWMIDNHEKVARVSKWILILFLGWLVLALVR